jgi:CheY-like chemotaxis protein
VPKVLVSNNSELLRHLMTPPFRRLELELLVASSGDEALKMFHSELPTLAILDAELSGVSGYDITAKIKEARPDTKVVLVMGKRLMPDQMRKVAESGCDEVLIAPMSADELYDVVSIQLGRPRRGAERYRLDIAIGDATRQRPVAGTVTNLSVDGVRLVTQEPIAEGAQILILVQPEGGEAVGIPARVIWAQPRDGRTVAGAAFDSLDDRARAVLARLTQWEIVDETARTRVVLKGDFTEATSFDELLPAMVGRVDFDLAQVTYMNSLGVRAWCEFLNRATIQGYEFHACSVPFVLQASMVEDVLGRGTVTSFFAPYHCSSCDHQEERLLQSAAILAASQQPPTFACTKCDGELTFDDIPERYFAFLTRDT